MWVFKASVATADVLSVNAVMCSRRFWDVLGGDGESDCFGGSEAGPAVKSSRQGSQQCKQSHGLCTTNQATSLLNVSLPNIHAQRQGEPLLIDTTADDCDAYHQPSTSAATGPTDACLPFNTRKPICTSSAELMSSSMRFNARNCCPTAGC